MIQERPTPHRRCTRLLWAALLTAVTAVGPAAQPLSEHRDLSPLEYSGDVPPEVCGTGFVHLEARGPTAASPLPDGEPLFADQSPPILTADYRGTLDLTLHVVGDYASIEFERSATDAVTSRAETWERAGTRTVDGRVVSIFERTYAASELAGTLRRYRWGHDNGGLFWGSVRIPGSNTKRSVRLRIGSTNLPAAAARSRIRPVSLSDDVQWAGAVVNIRIPGFGDSRVQGGSHAFDLQAAAKKFFEYFPDSYDSIAFITQSLSLASYGAYHLIVKNEVSGIGQSIVDKSADYGSRGRLAAVEMFLQTSFTTNESSAHEMTHQWANYIDWPGITGIEGRGLEPSTHTPLVDGGSTLIGAVLEGTRRVKQITEASVLDGSDFEIERTPNPIRHHPLELYAMGKLSAADLGTVRIFEDQGQFDPTTAVAPEVGTTLKGGLQEVTAGAIIGKHGARSGPSPSEWHRATVVVSRNALLSQEEMAYWNFFAERLADPDRTGVPSYEGYVSFDAATGNAIDLRTDVAAKVPLGLRRAAASLDVSNPSFGTRDWRGVQFDDPVPSTIAPGELVRLTGTVTATDRTDFNRIEIRFWKYGGTTDNAVRFPATVSRSGRFMVDIQFTKVQRGTYSMDVLLYWPDSEPQYPRGMLTPVIVS